MPRYKKCKICGEPILPDSPFIPYQNGYTHEKCFEIQSKTLLDVKSDRTKKASKTKKQSQVKPKAELKEALSEAEYQEKKQYYNYLKTLTEDNKLTPKIYTLSEKYIKEYGVTFYDLYLTLVYLNEIIEKELKGDIVGIIPFFISEATDYYKEVDNVYNSAKNVKIADMYQTKIIQINPTKRKVKQIDITSV